MSVLYHICSIGRFINAPFFFHRAQISSPPKFLSAISSTRSASLLGYFSHCEGKKMSNIGYEAGILFLADTNPVNPTPKIIRWQGRYFQWDRFRYITVTDESMEAAASKWLARNLTARTVGEKSHPVTRALVADMLLAIRSEAALDDKVSVNSWIGDNKPNSCGPWLATPGGLIDLDRLSEPQLSMVPNDGGYFCLTAMPVTPAVTANCPQWLSFIEMTFGRSCELSCES